MNLFKKIFTTSSVALDRRSLADGDELISMGTDIRERCGRIFHGSLAIRLLRSHPRSQDRRRGRRRRHRRRHLQGFVRRAGRGGSGHTRRLPDSRRSPLTAADNRRAAGDPGRPRPTAVENNLTAVGLPDFIWRFLRQPRRVRPGCFRLTGFRPEFPAGEYLGEFAGDRRFSCGPHLLGRGAP